jgi:hypothetical protein
MVRNIPNKYTATMLLDTFNQAGFEWTYDFFYLPVDFRNNCNVGYAFINFQCVSDAHEFQRQFEGKQLPAFQSRKILKMDAARVQGLAANRHHFRNSLVTGSDVNEDSKPILFDCDHRQRIAFPRPDWEATSRDCRRPPPRDWQNRRAWTRDPLRPEASCGGRRRW